MSDHARRKIGEALDASDWVGDDAPSELAQAVINKLLRSGYVIVPFVDVEPVAREYLTHNADYHRARRRLREAIACRCEMIHGHCYASGCLCPQHAEEVGA